MRIWTDKKRINDGEEKTIRRFDLSGTQDLYSTVNAAVEREKNGTPSLSGACGSATEVARRSRGDSMSGIGSKFAGCTLEEFYERKYGWSDGLDKVRRLSELDAMVHATQYKKTWSDYDGDNMDVERYYNEQPFLSRRVKTAGGNRRGQYRIVVNLCESSNVNAKNMLWKAYAAARLCDEIESQGNRVEVVIGSFYSACVKEYDYTWVECVGKRAQDPVNLGLLCTLMSPWMLRIAHFSILFHYAECNYGLGHACQVKQYLGSEIDKTAVVIDTGDCLSHEAADVFIRTMDIGTEFEMDID